MGPLLYLTLCSVRNRARVRLKRLKEPRYLIGLIVGLGYLWLMFWRPRPSRPAMVPPGTAAQSIVELASASVLFVLSSLQWILPGNKRPALYFTQSDVQFLFSAPLTRKELIRYKLARSQTGVLIGSFFMTLVFRPSSIANSWMFFVGMALTMTILNLHSTGISLSRESLSSHGIAGIARQWLPPAVVIAAVIVVVGTGLREWPALSVLPSGAFISELNRLGSTGAVGLVLWPFRAVVRVPLADSPSAFLIALPWALLILALNYVWVIRSDARFEEASAELAEKVARIRKGQQPSALKPKSTTASPFTLSLSGRAETAIFWKNLIMLGRYASLKTLIRFLPLFVAFATFAGVRRSSATGGGLAVMCMIVFALTLIIGPQLARNDLRQDLVNLVALKTWPIDGATLVRGEVMAPAALLTVIAWVSAIGGLAFARNAVVQPSLVIAALMLAPGIILLQLLAQNAIAVMFPSWVVTNPQRVRGIDVMGQRMIMMLGLMIVLVVAVLPAAIVGGLVGLGIYFLTGIAAVIAPAIAAATALFAEAFVASEAIGKLLDRTDVSAIDAQE